MEVAFYLTLMLLASFTRGNEIGSFREDEGMSDGKDDKDENIAFESFGSPVYGINNVAKNGGFNGKSAYNPPVPPPLTPNYASYLASLGLGSPFSYGPYSRYGLSPYAYPSLYGYGSSILNNPAFSSAYLSGLGYAGYGSPYFGRSVYQGLGYGVSPYSSNFGYRYGGYAPAPLRVPPAPLAPVPAPIARASAPVAPLPAPVPAVPNALPAPVPGVVPYRAPYRGKDGAVRYGYGPADLQALPVY